ncbi:MAG: metal-dependent transcriptional regulator [Christensenellales bacterium]|jgi:DtxR family Mn-dependent transcriptional regulator
MADSVKISTSSENYLEVIYNLSRETGSVRSIDVANSLSVSKASVNKAVSILRDAGLVEQELYGAITLTALGETTAKEVFHRHCTIKRFLTRILGVSEEVAEEDACRMEHVVSGETMRLLTGYLDRQLGDDACPGI